MSAVALSVARSVSVLPVPLRTVVLDHAYEENMVDGMVLEASVRLVDAFDRQSNPMPISRNEWIEVPVSTGERILARVVGQFVFVEF